MAEEIEIIYERDDIVVLNKPSGLLTHPTQRNEQETLVSWLLERYPNVAGVGEDAARPGIVHRLDKDTSGLIAVARTQEAYDTLKRLFHDRHITKRYWALVWGVPKEEKGIIEKDIAAHEGKRRTVEVYSQRETRVSRQALTRWRLAEAFADKALIDVEPKTGRTHQIRVHMQSIGHPLVCDKLYAGKKECPTQLNRLFLHAYFLRIPFSETEVLEFEIPLPPALREYIQILRGK